MLNVRLEVRETDCTGKGCLPAVGSCGRKHTVNRKIRSISALVGVKLGSGLGAATATFARRPHPLKPAIAAALKKMTPLHPAPLRIATISAYPALNGADASVEINVADKRHQTRPSLELHGKKESGSAHWLRSAQFGSPNSDQ